MTTLLLLATGAEPARLAAVAPGVAWMVLAVASLLSLERLIERDYEDGALDILALGPAPLEAAALAKCLAQWITTGAPLALLAPVAAIALGGVIGSFVVTALADRGRALQGLLLAYLIGAAALAACAPVPATSAFTRTWRYCCAPTEEIAPLRVFCTLVPQAARPRDPAANSATTLLARLIANPSAVFQLNGAAEAVAQRPRVSEWTRMTSRLRGP